MTNKTTDYMILHEEQKLPAGWYWVEQAVWKDQIKQKETIAAQYDGKRFKGACFELKKIICPCLSPKISQDMMSLAEKCSSEISGGMPLSANHTLLKIKKLLSMEY